jgi:hypothetical protein
MGGVLIEDAVECADAFLAALQCRPLYIRCFSIEVLATLACFVEPRQLVLVVAWWILQRRLLFLIKPNLHLKEL